MRQRAITARRCHADREDRIGPTLRFFRHSSAQLTPLEIRRNVRRRRHERVILVLFDGVLVLRRLNEPQIIHAGISARGGSGLDQIKNHHNG